MIFNHFLYAAHFRNAQRHVAESLIFLNFMGDLKKVNKVNFRDVVQIKYKTSRQENFPISLDKKGISSPVKAVVHRLKISDLGHDYLSQIMLIFNSIKTPACELYLVYSATFFVAETRVNCTFKIFKDDLKASPNNNCMGASAEFLKILRVEEAKL